MKRDAPERCLHAPHAWLAWGDWLPAAPPRLRYAFTEPEPEALYAYRDRQCARCGTVQRENNVGKLWIIAAPTAAARYLTRNSPIRP